MRCLSTIHNRRSTVDAQRPAFTMVELLVVIGIITLLLAISFPVIGKLRESSREADTRSLIFSIESACQAYQTDFQAYPGVFSLTQLAAATQPPVYRVAGTTAFNTGAATATTVVGPRLTGNENVLLSLVGGLRFNPTTSHYEFDIEDLGKGPASLNTVRPGRKSAYMPNSSLSSYDRANPRAFEDAGRKSSFDTEIPEFVDKWPTALPLLILRARIGGEAVGVPLGAANNNVVTHELAAPTGQYSLLEITPYTMSAIGADNPDPDMYRGSPTNVPFNAATPHGLRTIAGATLDKNAFYPFAAYPYFTDPTTLTSAAESQRARKRDSIIIISAGRDRVYGTLDDIANFGAIKP